MSDFSSERSPYERELNALIVEYYHAAEQGEPLDQAEFVRQHPDFAAELREFFENVGQIEQVAAPLIPPVEEAQTSPVEPGVMVRYFGDYEILEEIGAGGMGVVYKARQAKLKKIVAVKMIKAGQLASEQEVRRFQSEARAAANLDHPGIVPVHEVGVHHGQHYYTMDYVGGVSLSQLHRDEPVVARRAAGLVKQLAEAMYYAHGQGIVHRDLKPANVLLTTTGVPRITDFGLAKRLWSDEESVGMTMTETGQVLGTAGYMSPEQAAGKTRLVGPPADIYALGAILYALLTGRAPFVGESQADTILQVLQNEPVSPRTLNPSIARDLETICLKCLEKEPHKRYGTAQLLADDLSRFLDNKPVLARPVSGPERMWRWCRRNPWVGATLGLVVIVALVAPVVAVSQYRLRREKENLIGVKDGLLTEKETLIQEKDGLLTEKETLIGEKDDALTEASWQLYRMRMTRMEQLWREKDWGHLERLLAESVPAVGEKDLRGWEWYYLQSQVERRAWRLHDSPEKVAAIDWDRHTGKLAVLRAGTIEIWLPRERRLLKSIRVPLAPFGDGHGIVRWSPDHRHLAVGGVAVKVHVVDTETEQIVRSISLPLDPDKNWVTYVDWSPDGDCVAVTVNEWDVHLYLWKVASERAFQSFKQHEDVWQNRIRWSPDPATCVTTSVQGWMTRWNTADWTHSEPKRPRDGWYHVVDWSPDGTRVAFGSSFVIVANADGSEIKEFADQGAFISALRWLDNGRLVTANEAQEIRIISVDQQTSSEVFRLHPQRITEISVGPDAQIASVALGESVKVWSASEVAPEHITLPGATLLPSVANHAWQPQLCAWHPQLNVLALVSHHQGTNVAATWSPGSSQVEHMPLTIGANSVDWNPSDGALVVETTDGTWKSLSWPPPANPEPTVTTQGWGPQYSSEGRFRADAEFNGEPIAVVDTQEKAATVGPKLEILYACAWHPREFCLAIAQATRIDLCYPLRDESTWVVTPFDDTLPKTRFLAWSRDGKQLLVGGWTGVIHVRDGATLEIVHTLRGHAGAITAIAESHDATRIVSAGLDGFLRWWDAARGIELFKLPIAKSDILCELSFSADGSWLAGRTVGGKVHVWTTKGHMVPRALEPSQGPKDVLPADFANLPAELSKLQGPSNIYGPVEDLNARIAAEPNKAKHYSQRSLWFAARQQWKEALMDAEKCLALEPRWYNRTDLARLYLNLGDRDRYQQLCRELLQDIERESKVFAKCASFRPLYLDPSFWQKEIEAFAPIVEAMYAKEPDQDEVRRTVIATRYRQGRWKECIDAAETMQPMGPTDMNGGYPWLFRIMAMHQLGETAEAESALLKWKTFIEQQTPASFAGGHWESHAVDNRLRWYMHNGREAQILYREASELIHNKREELGLQPTVRSSTNPSGNESSISEAVRLEQPSDQLWQQFDAFTKDGRWREAAELGVQLIERQPEVASIHWLAVPPVLVLAGDQAGYAAFCNKMLQRFDKSDNAVDAERTTWACLLLPDVTAPSKLPRAKLTKTLDDGTAPEWFSVFAWNARALLEYRSNDAELAVKYATKVKEPKPEHVRALHLAVLALAQQMHRHDEAQKAREEALELITRLENDIDPRGRTTLLYATILLREAEAKIDPKH